MEWLFLAADNAAALSDIAPVLSSISSVGFALWFAHYTTTVAMPRQAKENREALAEKDELHAAVVKELAAELRAMRTAYERWRDEHRTHASGG